MNVMLPELETLAVTALVDAVTQYRPAAFGSVVGVSVQTGALLKAVANVWLVEVVELIEI